VTGDRVRSPTAPRGRLGRIAGREGDRDFRHFIVMADRRNRPVAAMGLLLALHLGVGILRPLNSTIDSKRSDFVHF